MKRVFLIGNGVSMDVAETPHSRDLIREMVKYFDNEPIYKKNFRRGFFKYFRRVTKYFEKLSRESLLRMKPFENRIPKRDNVFCSDYIFNDLEVLLSFVELNKESPPTISIKKTDFDLTYKGTYFKNFKWDHLDSIKSSVKTYLYELFHPIRIKDKKGNLKKFCEQFIQEGDCIISLNYDLLIDQALWEVGKWTPYDGYNLDAEILDPDYKKELEEQQKAKSKVKLLKLHGSLNWSWEEHNFPNLITLELSDRESGISYFKGLSSRKGIRGYKGAYQSLTILPSYVKMFSTVGLRNLWKTAVREVSEANEIYMLGYSFPEADMLVDFLLSFIGDQTRVFIINKNEADELKKRMLRNYGNLSIDSQNVSFSEFVSQN